MVGLLAGSVLTGIFVTVGLAFTGVLLITSFSFKHFTPVLEINTKTATDTAKNFNRSIFLLYYQY